jgi:hypothetical protein
MMLFSIHSGSARDRSHLCHLGPGSRSSGRGLFGQKAFKGALLGWVVLVVLIVVVW